MAGSADACRLRGPMAGRPDACRPGRPLAGSADAEQSSRPMAGSAAAGRALGEPLSGCAAAQPRRRLCGATCWGGLCAWARRALGGVARRADARGARPLNEPLLCRAGARPLDLRGTAGWRLPAEQPARHLARPVAGGAAGARPSRHLAKPVAGGAADARPCGKPCGALACLHDDEMVARPVLYGAAGGCVRPAWGADEQPCCPLGEPFWRADAQPCCALSEPAGRPF